MAEKTSIKWALCSLVLFFYIHLMITKRMRHLGTIIKVSAYDFIVNLYSRISPRSLFLIQKKQVMIPNQSILVEFDAIALSRLIKFSLYP